jgi:carbon dioxide concentrating mechanism protein CcmN
MSLPPFHPPRNLESYTRGDVTIHPSAAIAPGVLIQAEPDSRIIIKAGVCIGMGTVLHAYQGTLEIQESVNLGAGVLIIGHGTIGANACIGTSTTVFNSSVEPGQVVAPGSLYGNTGRQIEQANGQKPSAEATVEPSSSGSQAVASSEPEPSVTDPWASAEPPHPPSVAAPANLEPSTTSELAVGPPSELATETNAKVYGQDYLNHLLGALLPHRRALSQPLTEDSPSDT